ncbi:MAG: ABC transporter ATP-binding protein [Halobacteria archaeon]
MADKAESGVGTRARKEAKPREEFNGDTESQLLDIKIPTEKRKPILEIEGLSKNYGDLEAVKRMDLNVKKGELLTILGPSGCGKTTTLRVIAGLEKPDDGRVRFDHRTVAGNGRFVEPEDRDIGIVFQDFALFPHLTVGENVEFGLENGDDGRVGDLLELVDLHEKRDASPEELSGGQKQRVALARSLAPEPELLLLDEPFSNLDVSLRKQMREEVRRILKEADVTAVSVTHDQEEALSISDRIAVMKNGYIEQVGTPEEVFQHPENRYVADFLGNASFIEGVVREGCVDTSIGEIDNEKVEGLTEEYLGNRIEVLVRPDDVAAVPVGFEEEPDGEVVYRQYDGPSFVYRVDLKDGGVVHCMHNHVDDFGMGTDVNIELILDHSISWYPVN